MKIRMVIALAMALCLGLPSTGQYVHAQTIVPVVPQSLRLPSDAFLPATVTTDEVEPNATASTNYIGTHHPSSYESYGRISGYYQRAVSQDLVYLRSQSSVFHTPEQAHTFVQNSVTWIATHNGGPAGSGALYAAVASLSSDSGLVPSALVATNGGGDCEGDGDADDKSDISAPADKDVTCFAPPDFPLPVCDSGGEIQGSDSGPSTPNLSCEFAGSTATETAAGYVDCESDNDSDDAGDQAPGAGADRPCAATGAGLGASTACVGSTTGSATSTTQLCGDPVSAAPTDLPTTDCSTSMQVPCGLVGLSGITPMDGRSWDELYGVLEVNQCVSEVSLATGSTYAAIAASQLVAAFTNVLITSQEVLQKACTVLPATGPTPATGSSSGAILVTYPFNPPCEPDSDGDDATTLPNPNDIDIACAAAPTPTPVRLIPGVSPVPSTGSLLVRVTVTPNPIRAGGYPLVIVTTQPGATCTAALVYSTGKVALLFNGSPQTADTSGIVEWTFHEQTEGGGGTVYVTCAINGQSASGSTTYIVLH